MLENRIEVSELDLVGIREAMCKVLGKNNVEILSVYSNTIHYKHNDKKRIKVLSCSDLIVSTLVRLSSLADVKIKILNNNSLFRVSVTDKLDKDYEYKDKVEDSVWLLAVVKAYRRYSNFIANPTDKE